MSSDNGQANVGGATATIGQMGDREGGLSQAQKRAALDNASVQIRLKDDKGEALDAALTDSTFIAKTDGDLKNLSGNDLIEEMRNNPLTQAKSGTAWAQANIAKAGLDEELDKLIEGAPIVEERQCMENITHLLAAKPINEMSPLQVKFLQQNLERLGMYGGEIDGDFTNKGLVAAVDSLVTSQKAIEKAMKGGPITLSFAVAGLKTVSPQAADRSGYESTLGLFREALSEVTRQTTPAETVRPPKPERHLQYNS